VSRFADTAVVVCELANLALPDGVPVFAVDASMGAKEALCAVRARLRYTPLQIVDLNWSLCNAISYTINDDDLLRKEWLRHIASQLAADGHSSKILVALLAANHEPTDALNATSVLS
jgi:hypothetical protein